MANNRVLLGILLLLSVFSLVGEAVAQEMTTEETNMSKGMFNNGDISVKMILQNTDFTAMNKVIAVKGGNWTAGETSVSELTVDEKLQLCGARIGPIPDDAQFAQPSLKASVTYAESFDWRNKDGKDWMTPVKSQSSCGSCWAFSAIGVVEAAVNIYANDPNIDIDLSEQHLVSDCCSAGDCSGGWSDWALRYVRDTGVSNESCFPYTRSNGACMPCSGWDENPWKVDGYNYVSSSKDAFKSALQEYGPLSVVLTVPDDWFYYTGGVYEPVWTATDGVGWANHAVVLVGWDDSENCWIIKNSWGSGWGESGYARVLYGNLEKYNYAYAVTGIIHDDVVEGWVNPVAATASSYYSSSYAPAKAIDDNTATRWFTTRYDGPPCWIQFDLGNEKHVSKVRAIIYYKDVPMTLDVQVSNDAAIWNTVVSDFVITEGGTFVEIPFKQMIKARYIRLNETGFARMYGQCTEFDAWVSANQPPIAYASANPTMVCIPAKVRFVGAGMDADGTVVGYKWEFGDGLTSYLREPYHLYEDAGIYTATLTVTDDDGATGSTNITITVRNNPIVDNGMKAYVWDSNAEAGWHDQANAVAEKWRSQGFNVTQHMAPSPSLIYQTIKDNDITVYWGLGHGNDRLASTGNGLYYASDFGNCLEERGQPLTIGVFQHCGEYDCCNDTYWLQESTQGNLNVVAQRFYGEGWCESCITVAGFGVNSLLYHIGRGYTYEDSVEKIRWRFAEGKKLGNKDLRYPQFCGDVNYDMVVNKSDIILLRNHINNSDAYPIHSDWDADVNGDGNIDANDTNLLANHINNFSAYPLNPRGWFINNCLPIATISADPISGEAPLDIAFTGSGSDIDGTVVSYEWIFGDDASSTSQNLTHTYTSPGTYTATLTVTDDDGATGSDSVTIVVTESTVGTWVNPVAATASSYYSSSYAPAKAIDDNTATRWFTTRYDGPPCWIQFDLGNEKHVSKVRAIIYYKDVPMTFDVQVSNDTVNWKDVVTGATITEGGTFVEIPFAQTNARYIRLHETGFARMYGQCTEFDAHVI